MPWLDMNNAARRSIGIVVYQRDEDGNPLLTVDQIVHKGGQMPSEVFRVYHTPHNECHRLVFPVIQSISDNPYDIISEDQKDNRLIFPDPSMQMAECSSGLILDIPAEIHLPENSSLIISFIPDLISGEILMTVDEDVYNLHVEKRLTGPEELAEQRTPDQRDLAYAVADGVLTAPLYPVRNVCESHSPKDLSCTLRWDEDPRNHAVSYTIVRKEAIRPAHSGDGTIIAKNIDTQVYSDHGLKPGILYTYAVFSIRGHTESEPAHLLSGVFLLKGLETVNIVADGNAFVFSWEDIEGSIGVQITRHEEGQPEQVISPCSRKIFHDSGLKTNVLYTYEFRTLWKYNGERYISKDVLKRTLPGKIPPQVNLMLQQADGDGNCEVSWEMTAVGSVRLICLRDDVTVIPNQIYSLEQMNRMGETIADDISMSIGRYAWRARKNICFRVAAFTLFGDNGKAGNTVTVATVQRIAIDEENTYVRDSVLQLRLLTIPDNIRFLYYLVTNNGSILTEKYVRSHPRQNQVDIERYRSEQSIRITSLPGNGMLTVSVIAALGDDAKLYWSPVTCYTVPNLPIGNIRFRIEWPVSGWKRTPRRRGAKLIVSSDNGRIPEMSLCCRQDGYVIAKYSPGMPEIVEIIHIAALDTRPCEEVVYTLNESAMAGVPENADLNLFLAPREKNRYNKPMATVVATRKMPAP